MKDETLLVTGGAGFIGSAVVRYLLSKTDYKVINLDKLTYAGNLDSLKSLSSNPKYFFVKGDITNRNLLEELFAAHDIVGVIHLAAETHVDKSIDSPSEFIQTNVVGTYCLLDCALRAWLKKGKTANFKFHHVSTDEVYGSLGPHGLFTENSKYDPSSPYSASKAASDHLVRAWYRTFGLPVVITNCSNNYGPYQYPEKFIPLMISSALAGKQLPVYGDGNQVRDWLFVDDHAEALIKVFKEGVIGETYNVGGDAEMRNIDVVRIICKHLDEIYPDSPNFPHAKLVTHVQDRPGHDRRYAIDCSKLKSELNWKQKRTFSEGIKETIKWYIENEEWISSINSSQSVFRRQGKI